MLNVVKDVGEVGNHEIILIGTAKLNSSEYVMMSKPRTLTAANLNGVTVYLNQRTFYTRHMYKTHLHVQSTHTYNKDLYMVHR